MNRVCSIFSQLLQFFPRLEFEQAVRETRAERHARGFSCWGQFVAMLFGSTTIAQIYRERWRIEVFFRYLKQNLRIKTFVGTSANALHIQIWTALIAMLLLKYLQLRARYGWSLSNLVALLRQQLFVYRDLQAWLDTPFEAPPALAGLHDGQLALHFPLAL